MLVERLSAWFRTDYGRVVQDALAGKERILPLAVDVRRGYPCRTLSACHFAALSFVRVAFKHIQRTGGNTSPSMARFLSAITERRVLEEMLSPCERLTNEQPIQLADMSRIPLFEGTLRHVVTKQGIPSTILLKQSLRQMQLHPSPVSAMVVSRDASTTVCLKLHENSKDVFLVLDFAFAFAEPLDHGRHPRSWSSGRGTTPFTLAISTSLEQTVTRLSGILPVDNHLVVSDRRWQAQLFSSCTICTFAPAEGFVMSPEAELSAIRESVALLRAMKETDDPGRSWQGEREQEQEQEQGTNRERSRLTRRSKAGPSRSSNRDVGAITPLEFGMRAPLASHGHARRVGGESLGEGSSARMAEPRPTFKPYEENKRHCRIFFSENERSTRASRWASSISVSSEVPDFDQEAYFECVVCFEDIREEEGIHLLPCAHEFCRSCLAGHVSSKIEERKFPVFCPLCMIDERKVNPSVVSGPLLEQLGISEELYTIWSELEMADLCVRVHCRRCNRSAFVDKEVHEGLEELRCPFSGCGHAWCKNCQQTISGNVPNHSCNGTEELDHLVRQMGWKYCPKCRTPVQKNGGCNHMTCAAPGCNTHFCYRCGKQITRTPIPFLVRSAVNAHFKQCTL